MAWWLKIALVAGGGSLGALARWGLQSGLWGVVPTYPLGTVLANSLGSFLAGLLLFHVDALGSGMRELVLVGFLGAMTTMAGFALEISLLVNEGRYVAAGTHWIIGAVMSIIFCMIGLWVSERIFV